MEREVRYCTTDDGVRIAYCVEGDGPPLLWCPIFVESFSLHHLYPGYPELLQKIGRGRQLVRYDMRGVGLSQRNVTDFSTGALARDIEAVATAAGLAQFALWGNTMSVPVAITYAATHPDALTHLVLFEVFTEAASVLPPDAIKGLAEFARTNWKRAAYSLVSLNATPEDMPGKEEEGFLEVQQVARVYERSTDGEVAGSFLQASSGWRVESLLRDVRTPTLVLHGLRDPLFPFASAPSMANRIRNAKLVPLQKAVGAVPDLIFWDEPEALSLIDDFLPAQDVVHPSRERRFQGDLLHLDVLTPREVEILRLIAAGRTNREISSKLVLSPRTVARHITNIYGKIGARGKADATAYAIRHGLSED